jgi:O-methyltransferase involved in polyketide biosynthesis
MAAVLDPKYTFIWLDVDHPECPELKQALKKSIIGEPITLSGFNNLIL